MRSIVEVQLKFRNPINTMKDGDWQWDAGIPKDAHSIQIRSHQIDRRNVSCQTVLARPELHYERRINRGVHARLAYNYSLAGSIIDKSRLLWLMIVLSRGSGHCVCTTLHNVRHFGGYVELSCNEPTCHVIKQETVSSNNNLNKYEYILQKQKNSFS